MNRNLVDVCFSPALFTSEPDGTFDTVVVVDVFRATTAIITAIHHGAAAIIPLESIAEALEMKNRGHLVAGESDGMKLGFADFGNSPHEFISESIKTKAIAYRTTNGTRAMLMAQQYQEVVLAGFVNLSMMCDYLARRKSSVIILCASWKNQFSMEDTLCAGAIVSRLVASELFQPASDAAKAALDLWQSAQGSYRNLLRNADHALRLKKLQLEDDIDYCLTMDCKPTVPQLIRGLIVKKEM
jgi:2-phosphosulfolactate phosphatase